MAEMTESLARAVLNGAGVTRNELEQLCRFFLAHQRPANRNDEALRACPFCGGKAIYEGGGLLEYHGRSHMNVWIECSACSARGAETEDADPDSSGYMDAAIAAWNTRPDPAGRVEWQPIETCPAHEFVLLWVPEAPGDSAWAAHAWKGMRMSDGSFSLATPYSQLSDGYMKQVWCPVPVPPTHWQPFLAAHAPQEGAE